MQVHWPLVISTACQRAGLGLLLCVVFANAVLGSQLPSNIACLVTLALLCAGGIASVFHLQRPSRFFNAFSNPKSHLTQEGFITPFPWASFAWPLASRQAAPELIRWMNPPASLAMPSIS